jgi:hypothetical protein
MPLLAAFIVERRLLNAPQSRSLTKLFVLLLLPCHLVLLVYGMVRWQRGAFRYPGLGRLNPLGGSWHPPTGSVVPLVVMVVGLVLLGWLFWRAPLLAAATPVPGAVTDEGAADPQSTTQRSVAVSTESAAEKIADEQHTAPISSRTH